MMPTMVDPLADSPWSAPSTVAGFAASPPNETLVRFAAAECIRAPGGLAIDIGCGAARHAVALAELGWQVLGTDLSRPMLEAATRRVADADQEARVRLQLAPMDRLPVPDGSADLIVAHGIWNLARSTAEFRRAVAEAARIARPGAGLFVFTFSRTTLPADARPIRGETFTYTEFSGEPQCFLTREELLDELAATGFVPDRGVPLSEHGASRHGAVAGGHAPIVHEAAFRLVRH